MGLDLYHIKACITPENKEDFYPAEELQDSKYYEAFKKFVITKHLPQQVKSICIIKDDRTLAALMFSEGMQWSEDEIFVGEYEDLQDDIREMEIQLKLTGLKTDVVKAWDHHLSEKLNSDISYLEKIYYEYKPGLCFCYNKVGYQRNGMQADFNDHFGNGKFYFEKQDVLRASQYINAEQIQSFKEGFIDSFVEGESIFYGDW